MPNTTHATANGNVIHNNLTGNFGESSSAANTTPASATKHVIEHKAVPYITTKTIASTPAAVTRTSTPGLPDSVSHFYYKHGLFISSYPTCASSIAIMAILLACYPLINIPLPGTIPTKIVLPYEEKYSNFGETNFNIDVEQNKSDYASIFETTNGFMASSFVSGTTAPWHNISYEPHIPWAQAGPPILYVQQITLRASVLPWTDDMQLMDAFRAPLHEVFHLLEIVRNHESPKHKRTLEQICMHVENVKRAQQQDQLFPEYGCLVLSPANLWTQNVQYFTRDTNILNTIYQYHNLQKTKVSTAEMLFGLPMQDTGFKRYPLRARSRIIQYALTLILKQNDKEFIQTLKEKLLHYYPPLEIKINEQQKQQHQQQQKQQPRQDKSSITYIFYPGEYKIWEFLPISIAFILVFMYIYYSVRKIDVFRSRILLALTSVIIVLGSLIMSLGLCFFFGLTISLQSKDIFPYLVILVGLENSLVITKSVVSMDQTFDVKIRVAQALSKEGWHITKTLLTEITILTIGLATFVPVIQEFCVFAIVGLLSDFMLQMLLFSTILAMNVKRAEYTTEAKHLPKMMLSCTTSSPTHNGGNGINNNIGYMGFSTFNSTRNDFRFFGNGSSGSGFSPPALANGFMSTGFHRSQSHPKLSFADLNAAASEQLTKRSSITNSQQQQHEQRIPKRIKIVNFWARTRFFQRAFMIWMSVWICSIIYNSGYLAQLFVVTGNGTTYAYDELHRNVNMKRGAVTSFFSNVHYALNSAALAANGVAGNTLIKQQTQTYDGVYATGESAHEHYNETNADMRRLLYPNFEWHYFLSNFHWPTIMKQYNISLSGHYVTILPTIKLSHAISPETAALVRSPYQKVPPNFQWKALAAALDPLDFNDFEHHESPMIMTGGTPLVPKSPMEIFFAITLCCISIFVLCYTMVVFYRCICTRNYAEWRSSWHESSEFPQKTEQILEGVPIQIVGHKHRIECLVSDGSYIISCCLRGQIKVWDARSGENISTINRNDMQIATQSGNTTERLKLSTSPIWCLDYFDNLIAVGCANGRIELWETPAGLLKCIHQEEMVKRNQGITHIHLNGDRVIVARLSGRLEFYRLETYYKGKQIDWGFTSAYRRTHVRTGSTGSLGLTLQKQQHAQEPRNTKEEMKITLEGIRLAHQQPITCMKVVNDMVFTGSQDHTLKVYCLNKSDIEYTLHGHCGPITCLFVDHWQPGTGGSGSQDGLLCVWDLFSGACMYNIQAHDGAVSCLVCAPSYVISLGTDERICVWERFQGNLLTTINISNAYSSLLMLTPSLLVTSKLGSLIVWDVRTGEPAREMKLDFANRQLCPKILMLACDSVVCDYGNEIRIVRFPIVADKCH